MKASGEAGTAMHDFLSDRRHAGLTGRRASLAVLTVFSLSLLVAAGPPRVNPTEPAGPERQHPGVQCLDTDTDGYAVCSGGCTLDMGDVCGDCLDNNGGVNPGLAEVCGDEIDNDCDGSIDFDLLVDDFGDPIPGFEATGSCSLADPPGCVFVGDPPLPPPTGCCLSAGHKECNADDTGVVCISNSPDGSIRLLETEGPGGDPSCFDGADQDCDAVHDHEDPDCQTAEFCNGFDDDFDGMIDEDFLLGTSCTVGVGSCQRTGLILCDGSGGTRCSQSPAAPGTEATPGAGVCVDVADNDCDGLTDLADPDCQEAESCDGLDNDGDGMIDEDFADLGTTCSAGEGACLTDGVHLCRADGSGTVCTAMPDATAAVFEAPGGVLCTDAIDNDCDGLIDALDPGCASADLAVTCALTIQSNEDVDDDDDPDDPAGGMPAPGERPGQTSATSAGMQWISPQDNPPTSGHSVSGGPPGADESECVGLHRVEFEVFGAGPGVEVTAEFLVLDAAGNLLAVVPVEDGDLVDLESELDPEEWAWASVGEAGNRYRIVAPVPLLRVRARGPLNDAEAYCAHIPYLDVVRPDGATVNGVGGADRTELVAAIPLLDPTTLSVEVDGIDILDGLGINPLPGTYPGGVVNINGQMVTVSDVVIDVAPSVEVASSNTLRLALENLGCGGHSLVVDGERIAGVHPQDNSEACAPLDDPSPFPFDCNCDDLHDCGSTSVFEIRIDSPTPGEITNAVPTPVLGEVCHGVEILRASVNGKELDASLQSFTPSGGECAQGTYNLAIDTALPPTNLFAEAAGLNADLGTFDAGVNRLIAQATDVQAHRAFKTFIFAVGEPEDLISTSVAGPPPAAPPPGGVSSHHQTFVVGPLDWDYGVVPSPPGVGLTVQGTAIVDAFVFGLEGEAFDQYLAATCADMSSCLTDSLNEALCSLNVQEPMDTPCCSVNATIKTIGCDGPNPPGFLGEFTCHVSALDGPGPDGTGGKIVVELEIPRVNFRINVKGGCHGGFLWGCNTDVDMDLDVTLPHPGDPDCEPGDPDVCPDLTMQDEDCCIPLQPLNRIEFEIEERDFPTADFPGATPASCACAEGDTDCMAMQCCDPDQPGCIVGTVFPSSVIRGEILEGGISVGGWNTVVLGILLLVVGGLLLGPLGALLGVAILAGALFLLFGLSDLSGFTFTPDILGDLELEAITQAVAQVTPEESPYEAMGLQIDTELASVKINSDGMTAAIDLGLQIEMEDPNVEDSLGFLSTPAPAPMPPIDNGNTFVVFSDDLINGIFAAATRQGLASTETCSGTLAEGACCDGGPDFDTIDDLFPQFPADCTNPALLCCDDPDFLTNNAFTNAAIIGTCLGLRAADLPEEQAEDLCEAFQGGPLPNDPAEVIGQATCHGVRDANCSQIPLSPFSLFGLERTLCSLVPPLNIKASDPMLICARTGIEPRFLITDVAGTPPVETTLRLNDLLITLLVDRGNDGYNGAALPQMASCLADATNADCTLLGVCVDQTFESSMQLVAGPEGPEVAFELGAVIHQERPAGEVCEGGVDLTYNYDPATTEGAAESDPLMMDLTANAEDAIPILTQDIRLGRFVQFASPELFAIKTGTEAGRCENNLDQMCTTAANCGGNECIVFQDYLGVRGSIVADIPPDPVCNP